MWIIVAGDVQTWPVFAEINVKLDYFVKILSCYIPR